MNPATDPTAQIIDPPDLSTVPKNLEAPVAQAVPPGLDVRFLQATHGAENITTHHALHFPLDWQPGNGDRKVRERLAAVLAAHD